MKKEINCYKVTLRREQIEKALVIAAVEEERDISQTSGLQAWWFEESEYSQIPSEIVVYLIPKSPPKPKQKPGKVMER